MNPILTYMIKTAFCIAVFYLAYSALLSRDTLYGRNRIFILISVISAFVFPLITIETAKPVGLFFFGKTFSEVLISGSADSSGSLKSGFSEQNIWHILYNIYIAGLIITGGKLLFSTVRVAVLIIRGRKAGSNVIYINGMESAGFSAMGYVFVSSRLMPDETSEIIKHEKNHIDHNHFTDILFIELIKVVQWFNPFILLFDRSLRAVHEYQADEGCIKSGVPVFSYQQLLLSQVFKARTFNISNNFSNPTLIKKRMIMMTKKRSRTLANLKLLMVLPVIAILLVSFSSCKGKTKPAVTTTEVAAPPPPPVQAYSDKKVEMGKPVPPDAPPPPEPYTVENGDTTWIKVQVMPVFPGGDTGLLDFIAKNTKYPDNAKKNNIQGRVTVRFCVTSNGTINQVKVIKGVDPELDAEAIRVVSSLPAFKPGEQDGKPVPVWYWVPISFALK